MRDQVLFFVAVAMALGAVFAASAQAVENPNATSSANAADPSAKPAGGEWLHAGPIRVKFEDGQLRYLYVGDREIVRRIYFGVRDQNWGTAMPTYSKMNVEKGDDHFTVKLAANCKMDAVDYSWTGVITGSADGKITFQVTGTPNVDFQSNRISLCVLFGVHSLAGQAFDSDGPTGKSEFPKLVSPKLVGEKFHKLQYATKERLDVAVSFDGAIFDMEDQRNWGDSSWKAYAPLPYAYKQVNKGDVKTETVTVSVGGKTDLKAIAQEPVHVKIGKIIDGARVPALVPLPAEKVAEFTAISFNREKFADAKVVAWSYIPTTHLPDADTIMENIPTVAYQARTVKSFNADCKLHVGPIGLSNAGVKDPRANTQMAAAWAAGMIKPLSLGGVEEAAFAVGDFAPAAVLDAVRPYEHQPLLNVETEPAYSHHLIAFAAENDKGTGLFLVNHTAHASHALVDELTAKQAKVLHIASNASVQTVNISNGTLEVDLAPYEVVEVTLAK